MTDNAGVLTIKELQSPYTSYCVLCDGIETPADGSIHLDRIVNRWGLSMGLPPVTISFWMAIGFKGFRPKTEEPITFLIINEEYQDAISYSEQVLMSDTHELNYFARAEEITFSRFGKYRFSVLHGDREIGRFPFAVELDPPSRHLPPNVLQ